jgi:hypothetical protein
MDSEIVMDMCKEISSLLPKNVLPHFKKGRHMKLNEALEKLQIKLG